MRVPPKSPGVGRIGRDRGPGQLSNTLTSEGVEKDLGVVPEIVTKPGVYGLNFTNLPEPVYIPPVFLDIDFISDREANEFGYYNSKPVPVDDLGLTQFRYVITQANTEGGIYTMEVWDDSLPGWVNFSTIGTGYYSLTTGGGGGSQLVYICDWLTLPTADLPAECVFRVNEKSVDGMGFFDTSNTGVAVQFRNGYAWTGGDTAPECSGGTGTIGNDPGTV